MKLDIDLNVFRNKTVSIGLVLIAIVSFFAWSEFKAYQIRSTIQEAFGNIGKGFSGTEKKSDPKKEVKTIKVAKWESYTMTGSNGKGQVKIGVMEVINLGKTYKENDYETPKQTSNTFYGVIIASENVGKEPSFVSLSTFGDKISGVTKDGLRFKPNDNVQGMKKYDGYSTCVSCDTNPKEKSAEGLLFDLPESFDGGTLEYKIDDETIVSFNL